MSSTFASYGEYYDLLYRDKDYLAESRYVEDLIGRAGGGIGRLLELGCGTGRHARCLAERGFHVTGVEMSETMLAQASLRQTAAHGGSGGSFGARPGDVRSFRADQSFDAVVSLFHVVSYLTTCDDLDRFFETASHHLDEGGLLVFDVWYGPAVLAQRPTVRVKRLENERLQVVRIAEPETDVRTNRVTVHYTIFITDKATSAVTTIAESHPMRYYFEPELGEVAARHGMAILFAEEWMTGGPPSGETWGVAFVAVKRRRGGPRGVCLPEVSR